MSAHPLVSIKDARLPVSYQHAKAALSKCLSLDECKQWKDKAAAIASYAKQADDETLENTATRIRAHAVRRCGELLAEVEPKPGARTDKEPRGGTSPRLAEAPTRSEVAKKAGLSPDQTKQALRVAAIPERKFERLIEAEKPPTITELAREGTKPKAPPVDHLKGRDPKEFNAAIHLRGALQRFAEACAEVTPSAAVRGSREYDLPKMKKWGGEVADWIEQMQTQIKKAM